MILDGEKVLVTGVSGFVGRAVVFALAKADKNIVAAVRHLPGIEFSPIRSSNVSWIGVGNIDAQTQWQHAFKGVTTVVHCAARVHVIREHLSDALVSYREVNVAGTLQLAQQAAAAGVRRFVFLSSIKVNGENTQIGEAFSEANVFAPQDAYGQSKVEAEQCLLTISLQSKMELVIIRPPLVVGPGVKGNFARMVQLVQCGLPLPLGAVHNKRSLVALDNLVSLIVLCADRFNSPEAANQAFVIADGEDLSTSTLLRKVAQASGCPSRLVPIPSCVLRFGASLFRNRSFSDRLLGNLQVDASKVRKLLGWTPVVTLDEQLSVMFHNKNIII